MAGLFSDPEELSRKQRVYRAIQSEKDPIAGGVMGWMSLFSGWDKERTVGSSESPLGEMTISADMNDYQIESNITNAYIKEFGMPQTPEELDKFTQTLRDYGADRMADRVVNMRLTDAMSDILSGGSAAKPKTSSLATLSETAGNIEQIMGAMTERANVGEWWGMADEFRDEDRPKIEKAINLVTQTPGLSPLDQQKVLQSGVDRTGGLFTIGEDLYFNYDTFLEKYNELIIEKGLTGSKQQPQQKAAPSYNPRSRLQR